MLEGEICNRTFLKWFRIRLQCDSSLAKLSIFLPYCAFLLPTLNWRLLDYFMVNSTRRPVGQTYWRYFAGFTNHRLITQRTKKFVSIGTWERKGFRKLWQLETDLRSKTSFGNKTTDDFCYQNKTQFLITTGTNVWVKCQFSMTSSSTDQLNKLKHFKYRNRVLTFSLYLFITVVGVFMGGPRIWRVSFSNGC